MRFHAENFSVQGFMPMGIKGILAALPTAGVIYAMIGFNPAVQLAAEVKNPEKSIGFAIIGAILTCVVLYTLLQVAFIGALQPKDFANGWANLSFAGDAGPFAGIIMTLVPMTLGLLFGRFILKLNPVLLFGALVGSGTITAALSILKEETDSLPTSAIKL